MIRQYEFCVVLPTNASDIFTDRSVSLSTMIGDMIKCYSAQSY